MKTFTTHNKTYSLLDFDLVDHNSRRPVDLKYNSIIEKHIIKDQTPYLQDVVHELNQLYFQTSYKRVRFYRMRTRFGSCSSNRNINIAFKLLFAPREVFRYVVIHELAHLIEFNHSKSFWKLVEEAEPDYKFHEKWLKENGSNLGFYRLARKRRVW